MHDIPGKFIGLLLAFLLLVIVPFANTSLENEMIDRRAIVMDVTNFIDQVVDSREITDAELREFNARLASYGVTVNYEITRYQMSVNPGVGQTTVTTYFPSKELDKWNTGDRIQIHVWTTGYSGSQALSHALTGIYTSELDRTFVARIR